MAEEPTPRQVLYGLVASGFHLVVGLLVLTSAPMAPTPWNVAVAAVWVVVGAVVALRWRRTGLILALTLATFAAWTTGAIIVLS